MGPSPAFYAFDAIAEESSYMVGAVGLGTELSVLRIRALFKGRAGELAASTLILDVSSTQNGRFSSYPASTPDRPRIPVLLWDR